MLTRPAGLFGTREIWQLSPRWLRRRSAASDAPTLEGRL
jgi:hypothetical protein